MGQGTGWRWEKENGQHKQEKERIQGELMESRGCGKAGGRLSQSAHPFLINFLFPFCPNAVLTFPNQYRISADSCCEQLAAGRQWGCPFAADVIAITRLRVDRIG
jgi:hypothetical protein